MRSPTRRSVAAFTLIELLVVVAVIALLVGLLLPALRGARDSARTTICLANQKTLALAYTLYCNDFKEQLVHSYTNFDEFPESWLDYPRDAGGFIIGAATLQILPNVQYQIEACQRGRLYQYAPDYQAYHCPSDTRNKIRWNPGAALAYVTYSIPNYLNGDPLYELNTVGSGKVPAKRIGQLIRPSDSFAFVEESDPRGLNINSWVMYVNHEQWIDPLTVWHGNQSTIGFADGHALLHRWQDLRTIRMSRDQLFGADALGNKDHLFLKKRWGALGR